MQHMLPELHSHQQNRSNRRKAGIVLIIVLVVTVLLALAAYGLVATVQSDLQAARTTANQIQLQHTLESGQLFVSHWLELPRAVRYRDPDAELSRTMEIDWTRVPMTWTEDTSASEIGYISIAKSFDEIQQLSPPGASPGDAASNASGVANAVANSAGAMTPGDGFPCSNESGKLHLRTLREWDRLFPGTGRLALMKFPGMTEQIADAILDWIDEDNDPREFGAEESYYSGAGSNSLPRNDIPLQLDELLFVRDVTSQLLYGGASPENSPFDSSTSATSATSATFEPALPSNSNAISGSTTASGWDTFLTVLSAERNETWTGEPRIHINNDNLAELYEQLSERLPTQLANYIIALRQFGPPKSSDDSQDTASFGAVPDAPPDLTRPARYQLKSLVDLFDTSIQLGDPEDDGTDDEVLTLQSPLTRAVGAASSEYASWVDALTLHAEPRMEGLVNLVDAPTEVLAGIPEMDEQLLSWIIAQRETGDARQNLVWFWSTNVAPRAKIEAVGQWITTGGDVVSLSIQATHASARMSRQASLVLDAAGPVPRRMIFREFWLAAPAEETLPADRSSAETPPSLDSQPTAKFPQ